MTQRVRHQQGSVVFDKRIRTWHYTWWEAGRRRSKRLGTAAELPTKAAAWREAARLMVRQATAANSEKVPTVKELVKSYELERLPSRFSTARSYRSWLKNHILPQWGPRAISELRPREVELWLRTLDLAPKSKAAIRGILSILVDYAMWSGMTPINQNPIGLVVVRGVTKRTREPRTLTVEEFHRLIGHLEEPVRTVALVCICFGLRISECLALQWGDVDWLNSRLHIRRSIVRQHVDDVKTVGSAKPVPADPLVLERLRIHRQSTEFHADSDWIFSSVVKLGRKPLSYTWILRAFQSAAKKAGIGQMGTHSLRHSHRAWLDAVGTSLAVQQRLMRHSDIRTTMSYGDIVTDEMSQAHSRVVGLALNRPGNS